MFAILDYSSALEYSIIRRYTNIVLCISARVWNVLQKTMDVNVSASKFKHIS